MGPCRLRRASTGGKHRAVARTLVAVTGVWDLSDRAKDLLVAAIGRPPQLERRRRQRVTRNWVAPGGGCAVACLLVFANRAWFIAATFRREKTRWSGGFICPHCQVAGEPFRFANRPGILRCRKCRRDTGLTVGTVMARSHTPLSVWFWSAYLVSSQTPHVGRAASATTWSVAL